MQRIWDVIVALSLITDKKNDSANRAYRESFCGVLLDNEREKWEEMSPHRKKAIAKRRKKNKNKKTHRR